MFTINELCEVNSARKKSQ